MSVELATEATPELLEAMTSLLPQLSRSAGAPEEAAVAEMLAQESLSLLVFRGEGGEADGRILGMLSLVTFTIPTGVRAWVEDVVVHDAARGQGAGRALVEAAVTRAGELGARSVDLTSRPSREAANRLYQRCGFEKRETNVYRHQG